MDILEAQYYLTTPLFLGGANSQELEKPRPPSFKGVLRYWYRVLAWPRLKSWQAVKKEEGELFGTTKKQARFKLKLIAKNDKELTNTKPWIKQGCIYLGYGLMNFRGEFQRKSFEPGMMLTARLTLMPDITSDQIELLVEALKAVGLLGGLGARSRRGFGSLSLEKISTNKETLWLSPSNEKDLIKKIKEFINEFEDLPSAFPPYTALSKKSCIRISKGFSKSSDLLNELGKSMIRYRSYGQKKENKHTILAGEEAEQIFKPDHDALIDFYNKKTITSPPMRAVFGLPHNYFFKSLGINARVEGSNVDRQRRASPLFIHIHKTGNDFVALVSLLPAEFLPADDKIKICIEKGKKKKEVISGPKLLEPKVNYSVLEDFIDHASIKSGLEFKQIL